MSQQTGYSCNIASHLPARAAETPYKRAVVVPVGRDKAGRVTWAQLTFLQLNTLSDRYALGLERMGIKRGTRTVLMVKPSLEFFALVFALFKIGTVLVLIDPGLDRKAVLKCFKEVAPEAFIGIPAAHVARLLFRDAFASVRVNVTVGRRLFWGGHTLEEVAEAGKAVGSHRPYVMAQTRPDEVAALLFTSGSTGIPKGAVYTHGIFDAQVRLLRQTYHFGDDELELATFPLFALFDPALGMTCVVPDMDASKPGSADPVKLIEAIEDHGVTSMFGSPALLDRLSQYCVAQGKVLQPLRRVISAGAPVRSDILERMNRILPPSTQLFTPYGATESLPVCNIGHHELLRETRQRTAQGEGICVGKPVQEQRVRIIRITDEPIEQWSDALLVPTGEIGEIVVRGPVVTTSYYARPEQTRLAKIQEGAHIVHRMGDVGWLDDQGRLWMCGRKSHRVHSAEGLLFSVPVEEVINQHPELKRSALVWKGVAPQQTPVVLLERLPGSTLPEHTLLEQVRALAAANPITARIQHFMVYGRPFPVDIRHNAKIAREKLAEWLAERPLPS